MYCSRIPFIYNHFLSTGDEKIVRMLIEKGANINAVDENANSALILAASLGFEPIVQVLIEKSANINARNNEGNSPLILAASKGQNWLS